jgi:mycofactocin precursor
MIDSAVQVNKLDCCAACGTRYLKKIVYSGGNIIMSGLTTGEKVKQTAMEKAGKSTEQERTIMFEEELILEEITIDCICGVY